MESKKLLALALRIKAIRKQANFSQEKLALIVNIDRPFISRLERGIVNPSYLILLQISNALGKPLKEFIPN